MRALVLLFTFVFVTLSLSFPFNPSFLNNLIKRKGGGGGGKGGGGGGGGGGKTGGGGTSGGGGSGSGSRSSGGGSSSSAPRVSPSYSGSGGTRYFGGGATSAYSSGSRSGRGLTPYALLPVAALGGLWAGSWLYGGAYAYRYPNSYTFHNGSSNTNQTEPVVCLCQQYEECGCDDNGDQTWLNSVIGDGDPSKFNQTLVKVADVNGTQTILINGTLPNGTSSTSGAVRDAAAGKMYLLGWCVLGSIVFMGL